MRICLLGGTRFIGRAIAQHLAERGHELLIVHRGRSEPHDLLSAQHLHVDRAALAAETGALEAFAPEAVVDTYAIREPLANDRYVAEALARPALAREQKQSSRVRATGARIGRRQQSDASRVATPAFTRYRRRGVCRARPILLGATGYRPRVAPRKTEDVRRT